MANKPLTIQEAMLYPEAPLIDCRKKYSPDEFINTADYLFWMGYVYQAEDAMKKTRLRLKHCKLQLRSLSDLTQAEKNFIHREYLIDVTMREVKWDNIDNILVYAVDGHSDKNYSRELIDHLRRKNVMIEAEDWFELGKAIKG